MERMYRMIQINKKQSRLCAALLTAAVLLTLVPMAYAAQTDADPTLASYELSDYENGEVLAFFADGSSSVYSYDTQDALAAGIEALSSRSDVTWVQPNFSYEDTGEAVNDTLYSEQWALNNDGSFTFQPQQNDYPVYDDPFESPAAPGEWTMPGAGNVSRRSGSTSSTVTSVAGIDVNAEEAWSLYSANEDSSKVVVALIDTGVDYSHDELTDSIWINSDEIAGNGLDDDGNGYIDDRYGWNFYGDSNEVYVGSEDDHGTHCAGTIVASSDNSAGIAGIAGATDNIELMSCKVLGSSEGTGTTADIIEAIAYAEANGAAIANLSLGTSTFDYGLYLAMKESDMLFVVASGNDGTNSDTTATYPASYNLSNIISVANLQSDGTLASSSNYGKTSVDIAAPGSYILSTTTENTFSYMTGTSMAAPMVTAVAALVYSYYDDLTLDQTRQIILGSAAPLTVLDGVVATGGMLDAAAALSYDLTTLTDTAETTDNSGSAPVLSYNTYTQNGSTYLTLTIADADSDVCLLCYANGTQTTSYFNDGSVGTQVSLSSATVTFRVYSSGTFTFYAADLTGNETTLTVTVSAPSSSTSSGSTSGGQQAPSYGAPRQGGRNFR